jgi:nucleotidyltransferase/DNA polymerase involved in DNA repair
MYRASSSHVPAADLLGEPLRSGGSTPLPGSRTALCLWLPTFELRLELVRFPELDSTSVALLAPGESSRREIWQVSDRAHEAGVRPGMLVSQAVGLCSSITLLEPDPTHYDAAMDAVLESLEELSPVVEAAGRGRIFIGTDGLDRLFGSPHRQVDRALGLLLTVLPPPLVAATRVGMAPGKFGAWVAAVSAIPPVPEIVSPSDLPGFLASRPVTALPVDNLMIQRLQRLNIETLGDLSRLPETALTTQFGSQGREALAWATGRRQDPVRPRHRPRPIRVSLDFPDPVGQADVLHGAMDRLIERALARPARRGRSILGIRVGARLEGGGSWVGEVVLKQPTARRDVIRRPLRSRMALSPPPRAVEGLSLEFFEFGPPTAQATLFDRKEDGGRDCRSLDMEGGVVPGRLREAVRELKLRLGYSPLYRVVEVDPWSRIPERRHALLSFEP